MLQSLEKHTYLSDVVEDPEYWIFKYTLFDDLFGQVSGEAPSAINVPGYGSAVAPIIIEYNKRGLNVEAQLAIYLLRLCKSYDNELKWLLADYDRSETAEFQKLWKTVDQSKILMYAIFG
jgi:hypothetical protein